MFKKNIQPLNKNSKQQLPSAEEFARNYWQEMTLLAKMEKEETQLPELVVNKHQYTCQLCHDMLRRGYPATSKGEQKYFGTNPLELKPVKYKLVLKKSE